MKPLFPPIGDPAALPRRVLVFAPHADDEVFAVGGMLAFHTDLGAEVRVVVVTDGAAGDPRGLASDLARLRAAESRAAGERLGVTDYRFLDLPDGGLSGRAELAERLRAELEEFDPGLVYGPSPQEMHPDHRALARALVAALSGGKERRVLLYSVNAQVTPGILFDVTPVFERKLAAVRCFASQIVYHDLEGKVMAVDRARTVNVEDPNVRYIEGFVDLSSRQLARYEASIGDLLAVVQGAEASAAEARGWPAATAVISTWNKAAVLRENLDGLRAQTVPFAAVIVVDNASTDGTAELVAREYPEVRLIVMPHSRYGACETFNVGFASATTPLVAILDDDVVLPPRWLELATTRLLSEPEETAVVSTEVIEPGMPEEYLRRSREAGLRTMSTFRGCGSLAWREKLARAGFYDERLFLYGNERDLTYRLTNLGYRVVQDPAILTYHKTPFGIQMGRRSLYFHARNAWLTMLKYAPLSELVRLPFLVGKVLLRGSQAEARGEVTDATGTIGIGRSIRETPGAWWVLAKAAASVLANVPYCLRHRQPVARERFEPPLR